VGASWTAAKRHAAFVRTTVLKSSRLVRAGESAVAAGALPAQSMTRIELPGVPELPSLDLRQCASTPFLPYCTHE
jgi:hypothetical protein